MQPDYEMLEFLYRKIKSQGLDSFSMQEISTLVRGQQEVIVDLQKEIDTFTQVCNKQANVYDQLIHSDSIGSFRVH